MTNIRVLKQSEVKLDISLLDELSNPQAKRVKKEAEYYIIPTNFLVGGNMPSHFYFNGLIQTATAYGYEFLMLKTNE